MTYFIMWDTAQGPQPGRNPDGKLTLYATRERAEVLAVRMKEYSSTGRFKVYPWPFKAGANA
jgi:hypothetical protein